VTPIPDCSEYSTSNNTTRCVRCASDKVLLGTPTGNSACDAERETITGCVTYVADSQQCADCGTGKLKSTDGKKCLDVITNCFTHSTFTQSTAQADLTCTQCVAGYYLDSDSKSCLKGDQANCSVYNTSSNTCSQCTD
jgi:hypothetical protein